MCELSMEFAESIVTEARARVLGGEITTEDAAIGIARALAILLAHEPDARTRSIVQDALLHTIPDITAAFAADPAFRAKAASPDPSSFMRRTVQ
jgi:hypothetical protein